MDFQQYITFVCIIIFVILTAIFVFLITIIGKQQTKMLDGGLEDEKLKKTTLEKLNKDKKRSTYGIISKIFSGFVCAILGFVCIFAIITAQQGNKVVKGAPTFKVVASSSMSARYERNTYLFLNNITNQIQMFDLIVLHELPPEDELQLYDVVVYEHISGALLVHRIVRIEEPNIEHPNERYFLLQGDANAVADVYPVRYSQMKSIYRNERIQNIGSFIFFLQSPAGTMCILLVVIAFISLPIIDDKFMKKEYARVKVLVEKGELPESALDIYAKINKKEIKKERDNEKD